MLLPSHGFGSALLMLTLALAPLGGCGDDLPDLVLDGGNSTGHGTTQGTSTSGSTGPATTMVTSADTTVGSVSDSMGSTGTSSSSGDPGSTSGTTQGVSVTGSSTGDSTSDATTSGGTTSGSTSDATTVAVTSGMTSGTTSGMTSVATDFSASSSGDLVGTTDTGTTDFGTTSGGTTDMTGGATDDGATGGVTEVPDFSGDFLFVVSTPLDPTLPFQYVANFDYVPTGLGGGTVDVELQPLALDTGSSTTPRTFFGPPLVYPAIPVTPDGTFAIPVGILSVAAETNPLFLTDAQANNVVFSVQVLDADDLCGTVTGLLVFPVASPLDGTTLAAVRVADVMPPGLPLVFPVACP